jgi:RHS repeat-associated protein
MASYGGGGVWRLRVRAGGRAGEARPFGVVRGLMVGLAVVLAMFVQGSAAWAAVGLHGGPADPNPPQCGTGIGQDNGFPFPPSLSITSHPDTGTWYQARQVVGGQVGGSDANGFTPVSGTGWFTATSDPNGTRYDGESLPDGRFFVNAQWVDGCGWFSIVVQTTVRVDGTPPPAPSVVSSTHPNQTSWYSSRSFAASLSSVDATSYVAGYAVLIDQLPSTDPGAVITQGMGTVQQTLASDGVWWMHARAIDAAGNASAVTNFKIQVDTVPPLTPVISSSSHPDQAAWYTSGALSASWTADSGASGSTYATAVNTTPNYSIPTGASTTSGTTFSGTYGEGVRYLHVRARDAAGNWSPYTAHFEFRYDLGPPAAPSVSSSTHAIQTNWYAAASFSATWGVVTDPNGPVVFQVAIDHNPTTIPSGAPQSARSYSIAAPTEGIWYLHVRSVDAAGRWSATTHFEWNQGDSWLLSPLDGARTARYLTLQGVGKSGVTGARFQYRRSPDDAWLDVPIANLTDPGGGPPKKADGTTLTAWPTTLNAVRQTPIYIWDVAATTSFLDGPVEVRALFSGTSGVDTPTAATVLDQNLYGGSYATREIGPCKVNLRTGNCAITATDVSVASWVGSLDITRTFNSTSPAADVTGPYGAGWAADFGAPYRRLDDSTSFVTVTTGTGTQLDFRKFGSTYLGDAETLGLALAKNGSQFELSDNAGDKAIFTQPSGAPAGVYAISEMRLARGGAAPLSTAYKMTWSNGDLRLDRIAAPTHPTLGSTTATTCVNTTPAPAGCRVLVIGYAATTTATGTNEVQWGDYAAQVNSISFYGSDSATSATTPAALASYLYDSTGHLRAAWNPLISPALKTRYSYDGYGHVQTITPPGLATWTITYAPLANEPVSTGRVGSVSHPAVAPASGTASTALVYQVPISGAGAPWDLSSTAAAAWSQQDLPTTATALFPEDHTPGTPVDYTWATIAYLDDAGRLVNVADPTTDAQGYITTAEYDATGHAIRTLSPQNRKAALNYGTTTADHAARAVELDSHDEYNSNGLRLTDQWGPLHRVVLNSGEPVLARNHSLTTFDAAAPNGATYNLPTRIDTGARVRGETVDRDVRSTTYEYDGQSNLGWAMRQPTAVVVDPGSLALRTVTLYDTATGAPTEIRLPANTTGGDAHATVFNYYTADASATDAACRNAPAWAGLLCDSRPGGQPPVGSPLAVKTVQGINRFGEPQTMVEDVGSGSTTRTTTATYDAAGRMMTENVTGAGVAPGASLPAVTVGYDPATGFAVTASTTVGGTTAVITHAFDTVGRLSSYTDADQNVSTVAYDIADRPVTLTDGKGTQQIAYNQNGERRGLATTVTDSAAGAFSAAYDPDGNLVQQTYPNGLVATYVDDETDTPVRLTYAKSGSTWLDFQQASGSSGQIAKSISTLSSQLYKYDNAGRLNHVEDTVNGACVTRDYGFDADSNRTSLVARPSATSGDCDTAATGSTQTHTYDAADRITDAGYSFDPLGRITQAPAADAGGQTLTATYFVNDRVATLSQGGRTKTWTLDPVQRPRTQVDSLDGSTRTNHYADDSDSPIWTSDNATGTSWTRNIPGLTGLVATQTATGTQLELTDLRGSVVATASTSTTATGPTSTFETDEYGVPRSAATQRYGWLGSAERETALPTGAILMGQRVYVPGVGRFLQPDPVAFGSANAYDYVSQDPINEVDPTGQFLTPAAPEVGAVADVGAAAGEGPFGFVAFVRIMEAYEIATGLCEANPVACVVVVTAVVVAYELWSFKKAESRRSRGRSAAGKGAAVGAAIIIALGGKGPFGKAAGAAGQMRETRTRITRIHQKPKKSQPGGPSGHGGKDEWPPVWVVR